MSGNATNRDLARSTRETVNSPAMTSASIEKSQPIRGLFRALWERHKRGYIFIALLLFGIAALFRSSGWVVVVLIYAVLLAVLEVLYRTIQSLVKNNKHRWWAKPRREFPRAYGVLAVLVVILLVESEIVRSWLVAAVVGAIVVAAGIRFHRAYEENE
jgi:cobalamin synthase